MRRPRLLTRIAVGACIVAGAAQLSSCVQTGEAIPSTPLEGDAYVARAYQKLHYKSSSQNDFDYRGALPYNGEPPGYYGASGNSFIGGY